MHKLHSELSIGASFGFAWRKFWASILLFIFCEITIVGFYLGLEIFTIWLDNEGLGLGLKLITHLIYLLLNAGLWLGLIAVTIKIADGASASPYDFFAPVLRGPVYFIGQLVYAVVFIIGLALLIVPGFYWGGRLMFFGYVIASDRVGVTTSFERSVAATNGAGWKMAQLLFVLVVFNILGAALMGLGLIITIPMSFLVLAHTYRALQAAQRN